VAPRTARREFRVPRHWSIYSGNAGGHDPSPRRFDLVTRTRVGER
jgi:hypothetical protein